MDPSAEKRLRAKSLQTTFEAVARKWHSNQTAIWTENYANDAMERIAKNIFPYLGNRPIAEITPPELLAVLRKIEIRGAVGRAHRVRGIYSLIFVIPLPQAAPKATRLRPARLLEKPYSNLPYGARPQWLDIYPHTTSC